MDLSNAISLWTAKDAPAWACEPFGILNEHAWVLHIPPAFNLEDEWAENTAEMIDHMGMKTEWWITAEGGVLFSFDDVYGVLQKFLYP